MFYHIYFVSQIDNVTTVEYKKSVATKNSITVDGVALDRLVIPVVVATETEDIPSIDKIFTYKTLIVSNPVYRVPKPTVDIDSKGNLISNDKYTLFYYKDKEIQSPLKNIDYNEDTVSVYGIAYRDINTYIAELDLQINKVFYSSKSDQVTIAIKEEFDNNNYLITHVDFGKWEFTNTSKVTLELSKDDVVRRIVPNGIITLPEGTYTVRCLNGIVLSTTEFTVDENLRDLSIDSLDVVVEQIDSDTGKVSWSGIEGNANYAVYINGKKHFSVEGINNASFTLFKIPKDKFTYEIRVTAYNEFSSITKTVTAFAFDKPSVPIANIRGIDDVVFQFKTIPVDSAKIIVYGVEHVTGEYKYLGESDARDKEFTLTKEMLEYSKFVYRYSVNNSFSEYSSIFEFEHPLILNRHLMIEYKSRSKNDYIGYELRWCPDPKAQGYSVHKNNIRIATLNADAFSYSGFGYLGDFLCLHSYYGLKEAESRILYIGDVTEKIALTNVSNIKVDKIVDKTITVSWDSVCTGSFLVDVFVLDQTGQKIKVFSNLTDSVLEFIVPNYDTYSIQVRSKRKEDPTDMTDLSAPLYFTTYKAGQGIVIEDCKSNSFIFEMEVIDDLIPSTYHVEMVNADGSIHRIESESNRVILPIYDRDPRDLVFYIVSGYITTGISDLVHYDNANDVAFHATVSQTSNLPYNYGNFIKIEIDDNVNSRLLPISDFVTIEELSRDTGLPITPEFEALYHAMTFEVEGDYKKACRYDIIIEKSNGEVITYEDVKHIGYDNYLIFGSQFNTKFYDSNNLNSVTLPLVLDLEELVDARVIITGYRFNHSYTVELDYTYQRPPKPVEIIKAVGDYRGDGVGYNYTIYWKQEPDTLYRVTNLDNGNTYELKTDYISITSTERVNRFSVVSYNVTAITEPVELTFPEILPVTDVSTTDGNKIVTMNFTGVDNVTHYELFIDDALYMTTEATDFLLKRFKGEKDIIIRGAYKNGLYEILGIPTVYKYIPIEITGTYIIIYDIISEDRFLRAQLENETIEDTVRWINFVVRNKHNAVIYERTLDMPIDDHRHVFEILNTNDLSTVYMELVHGWTTVLTNIIDLREGLFLFNDNDNSFGSYFA